MSDGSDVRGTLRDGLQVLFLERRKIQAVFIITVLVALIGVYLWPPTYVTESKILVKMGREIQPGATVLDTSPVFVQLSQNHVNTEIQILRNRNLVDKVVTNLEDNAPPEEKISYVPPPRTLRASARRAVGAVVGGVMNAGRTVLDAVGLYRKLTPRQQLVEALYRGLSCDPVQDTNMLVVRLHWGNAVTAPRILNELIRLYEDHHLEVYGQPEAEELFQEQAENKRVELAAKDAELAAFKNEWGIQSFEEQQTDWISQQGTMLAALYTNEQELSAAEAEILVLEAKVESMPEQVLLQEITVRNPAKDHLNIAITMIKNDRARLSQKFTEDSDTIKAIDREIAAAESLLESEQEEVPRSRTMGRNAMRSELENALVAVQQRIAGLQARDEELKRAIAEYDARLDEFTAQRPRLQEFQRDIADLEENIKAYKDRAEDARVGRTMDELRIANIAIVEHAEMPSAPVRPRKLLTLVLAIVFGLLLGVGYGLMRHHVTRTIVLPEQLRGTNVPFLAAIPDEPHKREKREAVPPAPLFEIPGSIGATPAEDADDFAPPESSEDFEVNSDETDEET